MTNEQPDLHAIQYAPQVGACVLSEHQYADHTTCFTVACSQAASGVLTFVLAEQVAMQAVPHSHHAFVLTRDEASRLHDFLHAYLLPDDD